jgi:hypothetical protein
MSVPLRDPSFEPFYSSFDEEDEFADRFALSPGERIGGPGDHTSDALAWVVSLIIILCAGWFLTRAPSGLLTTIADLSARALGASAQSENKPTASSNIASAAAPPAPPVSQQPAPQLKPAVSSKDTPPPSAPKKDIEAASKDKPVVRDDIKTASLPSSEHDDDAEAADRSSKSGHRDDALAGYSPARLEVPKPQDLYQSRAEAVGLHPGLSHAVLARFSPTDFRNARTAIDTAVAKTPDSGTFIWPRSRQPGRALFKVHFVAGAPPDCRRYVVTVTMDGWTTTALPMEKCGVRRIASRK